MLARLVQDCKHIAQIDQLADSTDLRAHLLSKQCDLTIVVPSSTDENLPACLLRYPDMRVLVVTSDRKTGPTGKWVQQGANQVISQRRPERLRQTLEMLIEICITQAQLRLVKTELSAKQRLQDILLDSHLEAILLWQDNRILQTNHCFDSLIGCKELDRSTRERAWKQWLTPRSYGNLSSPQSPSDSGCADILITNAVGERYHARSIRLAIDRQDARLIRINTVPLDPVSDLGQQQDSVTGFLHREYFAIALERWLQTSNADRITIAQIHVNESEIVAEATGSGSTYRELLVYRIAHRLGLQFKQQPLLGRTGATTLALVPSQNDKRTHRLATRIRLCLGTVGGMVTDTSHVQIKTLTIAPSALSGSEVLDRLEQSSLLAGNFPPHKQQDTATGRKRSQVSSGLRTQACDSLV